MGYKSTMGMVATAVWLFLAGIAAGAQLITISGTVTYQGTPMQGVSVVIMHMGEEEEFHELTTDAQGTFSVQISAGGFVDIHVQPDKSLNLADARQGIDNLQQDKQLSFILEDGYTFSGTILAPDGTVINDESTSLTLVRMDISEGKSGYYTIGVDPATGIFSEILPRDIFTIEGFSYWEQKYYAPRTRVDLRTGDVTGYTVQLVAEEPVPIPFDPPDAAKISFGTMNDVGEVTVTGSAGAVQGLSHVLFVNLKAATMSHCISESDGSFSGKVFAPPGSPVMIKYGPPGFRWGDLDIGVEEGINPFPGTMMYTPFESGAKNGKVAFATTGGVGMVDSAPGQPKNQLAGWAASGEMSTGQASPGDTVTLSGTVNVYSPLFSDSTNYDEKPPHFFIHLLKLFDAEGKACAKEQQWVSNRLTPTGFPIQSATHSFVDAEEVHAEVIGFQKGSGRSYTATMDGSFTIPDNADDGIYMPVLHFIFDELQQSLEGEGQGYLGATVAFSGYETVQGYAAPVTVGSPKQPKLIMQMFMNNYTQGLHGVTAKEDQDHYRFSQHIVHQGEPYWLEPTNPRTGKKQSFRLEPFLPMLSFADRRMPSSPLLPLKLPSGSLSMTLTLPDGSSKNLGPAQFTQSFNRTPTTDAGGDLNSGTVQFDDVYSLKTAGQEFTTGFDQYGKYTAVMTAQVQDLWGTTYTGGGTYEFYVARTLDMDPGVMPGTGFEVGDAFNPTLRMYPRVPADVTWTLTHYPYSDASKIRKQTISGKAGAYGFFDSTEEFVFTAPGEYRVDLKAEYRDGQGVLYIGSMNWGGVVETPNPVLIAHGRRGSDAIETIPDRPWFYLCRDLKIDGVSHTFNPYFNGDILWTAMGDAEEVCGGDSLTFVASVFDTTGKYQTLLQSYEDIMHPMMYTPGDFDDRIAVGEIPLYSATEDGTPIHMADKEDIAFQGYYYLSSQRPGVRVREYVADSAGEFTSYWRLDTLYDDQLGVGVRGDQPNDFKFQYVGTVFRNMMEDDQQYSIQGTLWVYLPEDESNLGRAMPPFAGKGNGGWTTDGGPIMTLKGEDIHLFIHPTGVQPGEVLSVGDSFSFAGHVAPTLNSMVSLRILSPSGKKHLIHGQANKIGYYADPSAAFVVDEPGVWSVDIRVMHTGQCSGGSTVPPYPQGSVLGADKGMFEFYVAPKNGDRLQVDTPASGFAEFKDFNEHPILIQGPVPAGLSNAVLDYTIAMPGFILKKGQAQVSGETYSLEFNPLEMVEDFPNLDTENREGFAKPGLVDTISFGLMLSGTQQGATQYYANTITAQGDQIFIGGVDYPFAAVTKQTQDSGR